MEIYVNNLYHKEPVKQVLYQIMENTLDVDCNDDMQSTEFIFTTKEKAEEFVIEKLKGKLGKKYDTYYIEEVYLME